MGLESELADDALPDPLLVSRRQEGGLGSITSVFRKLSGCITFSLH